MGKEIIIFDFDGTLVDTLPTTLFILNTIRGDLNKPPIDSFKLMPLISVGGKTLIKESLEINDSEVLDYLDDFRLRYWNDNLNKDILYPGVIFVLDELLRAGVKLYLCSNKPKTLLCKSILAHNLTKYFIDIVAGDSYMEKKPHPIVLSKIFSQSCDLKKILIIGDSEVDEKLAENTGIDYYHYSGGYGDSALLKRCCFFDTYLNFDFRLIN